jgi:flagella basal body P-ring formation protein FlgA
MERTPVEYGGKTAIDAASLMGQRARRPIAAGRAIENDDLEAAGPSAVVIHQSDLVHLVAAVGPLQVRARGQALQEGRLGQLIQVRNTDSQSIVTGRVKDRSTVEVDY